MSNRIEDSLPTGRNWLAILLGTTSLLGLYAISRYNFLLFHCLAEAFSIIIAIAVFAIFWNTRHFLENGFYLIIGFGCLFAGILDVIYIFGYKGMSVFPGADGNIALQAKTAAQWFVSLSCVCAFPFLRRKINQNLALSVYSALLALALGSIFYWRVFPDCYLEGVGQTVFEKIGLVISCLAYLGAIGLLVGNRREFDSRVLKFLAATLIVFLLEDSASALATDINGFAKTLAHLCQVVALYLVYKAFVEVGLRKPYDLLFRSQQQAEETLRRSRDQLARLADNLPHSIVFQFLPDANGNRRFTYFSAASQRILGIAPEEVKADAGALYRRVLEPFQPLVKEAQIAAARDQSIFDMEVPVRAMDDTVKWLHFCCTPYHGEYGQTVWDGIATDVTDRKRMEEELAAASHRWSITFDAMADGVSVHDLDHTIDNANQSLCQMLGKTKEELIGRKCYQVFHGADVPIAACPIERSRETYRREYSERFEPMLNKWLAISVSPVLDDAGRLIKLVHTVRDVTERRRAEEALRISEARYRLLVETIPQLAWCLSPDGLEVDCNRRWYEYTGQTPAQVRAHGWLAVVHPDDLFRVVEQGTHALSTKEPYELEYRLRRASDATYRWHLSRAVPVLGDDGQVTCWVGSNTDIEDLKQAQEILKQTHDEQLQRHQAELAHVARLSMMGEMAASLAHELNQPLHAVKNYAYGSICRLAKRSEQDEEISAALEQISEEANRAAEIIRRVMAFVQKRESRFSAAAINGLVEEAVLFSRSELGRRRAKIVLELAKDLPVVMGDAIQIEQVIMNLVRNGLEAMDDLPDDNRLLGIKTMRQGEDMIQVDVRDCGKGLSTADVEKVFEPFFTTKLEGMGMGLAISRSIIHAHRGCLWATANQARGCTFHFTLPIGNED